MMNSKHTVGKILGTGLIALSVALAAVGVCAAAKRGAKAASKNGVTGLELGLDGSETAIRGSTLRWFFTLYEVVGDDELRPARGGSLKVLTSFKPDDAAAVLKTDATGHASMAIPIPEDVSDFEITIEASSGTAHRSFSMSVTASAPGRIELVADRTRVQPGETVTFVGRAVSEPSGRPLSNRPIQIALTDQDGRSLQAEKTLRTSVTGVFLVTAKAPLNATELSLKASMKSLGDVSASVSIQRLEAPRMVVTAVPKKALVQVGAKVPVEVTVRRSDGRPVKGATVRFTEDAPPSTEDNSKEADKKEKEKEIKTDENGFATLLWTAPHPSSDVANVVGQIWAKRAGLDKASTEFTVRTMRSEVHIGVAVEGGDLLPGLPSRIYVRATNADGTPSQKTRIAVASPMTGKLRAKTDADGIAVFETVPKMQTGIEGKDRCGGATASSLKIRTGDEPSEPEEEEDEEDEERCVPVDLDGTVRVRPSKVLLKTGETLEVQLHIKGDAASSPVELALLKVAEPSAAAETSNENDMRFSLVPASRQIVDGTGAVRHARVTLPTDLFGEFILRARPLIGPSAIPVRGGGTAIFVVPDALFTPFATVENGAARISIQNPKDGVEVAALVVPADEAADLASRLEESMVPAFVRLLKGKEGSPGKFLEASAAAHTPRDDAAPAVLRGKTAEVMPGVQHPPSFGILRDPHRARARFIRGRLALTIRTLEARLEELIPRRVNDIGFTAPDAQRFNAEALNAVKGSNFLEGRDPMTLGGDPLSLQDLERMDASFTFDNMARRVTRKHLLSLLIRLRNFVRARDLDLRVDGQDPTRWLDVIFDPNADEEYNESYDYGDDEDEEFVVDPKCIYDGWGRRMAIIRTKNGRPARFHFLQPLPPGFELVSAGPDGRFGTADDMADPFARVLPKGSVYAEAVGEDELIARLTRIEINRATLEAVSTLFEESMDSYEESSGEEAEVQNGMNEFEIATDSDWKPNPARAFERSWRPVERSAPTLGTIGAVRSIPFAVDDEPRRWSLVALSWTADGRYAAARRDFTSGFPAILETFPIGRLTPDEPLLISATGALLPQEQAEQLPLKGLEISVEGTGAVRAELESGAVKAPISIGPGGGFEQRIRLSAKEEGQGKVTVTVRDPEGVGRRVVTLPIEVRRSGLLRQLTASAAVAQKTELRLDIPRDAAAPQSALTLVGPDAMQNDPTLAKWTSQDPALIAWALTMAGRPIPGELLRRLEQVTARTGFVEGESSIISTACAAAAWAAVPKTEASWASDATVQRVTDRLKEEREKSAVDPEILAALSIAAAPNDSSPLGRTIQTITSDLRASVRRHRDDPWFLSRGAAALLLVDNRDIRGKTMLTLAKEHLTAGFRGGRTVDVRSNGKRGEGSSRQGALQLQAAAALAVAAHQVGDDVLAAELARGAAAEAKSASALGGETLFWMLAARAFGVFGIVGDDEPVSVDVAVGKNPPRKVLLGQTPVVIPLEGLGPKDSAVIRVNPNPESGVIPLAFASSTYVRPPETSASGPLRASLEGDAGFAGERSAYIATVANKGASDVPHPVLFLSLPSGAELDTAAKEAMLRTDGVLAVDDPDPRGTVRVRLKPLQKGGKVALPFAFLWSAAGRRTGLSLSAFPEDKSWELSVTPPREIDVPFRPEDAF